MTGVRHLTSEDRRRARRDQRPSPLRDRSPRASHADRLTLVRDGVRLARAQAGAGWERATVFIHGWGCDHSFLAPQQSFFAEDRLTVAVDLRGHGGSDAPRGDYSVSALADDVAWQCRGLGLDRPMLVGHSMGGHVALNCATRHPDLVAAVVMIDSVLFPSQPARDHARRLAQALMGPDHLALLPGIMDMLFSPTDGERVRQKFAGSFAATRPHVLSSALLGHVVDDIADGPSAGCGCPVAYIGADAPLTDRATLLARYPRMRIEQTVGSGHFSPLIVPDQINAMLRDMARVVRP